MPLSHHWSYPVVLHFGMALQPKKILDVGVGIGAYGLLLRQHLDIACERLNRPDWQLTIDGIEIFEPYRNPVWDYAYDTVCIGDVREVLGDLETYDLALCADVLEHFPLTEACHLVETLLEKASVVMATTPKFDCPQGSWGGNPAETHHCLISAEDLPAVIVSRRTAATNCFVMSRDPVAVECIQRADRCCYHIVPELTPTAKQGVLQKLKSTLACLSRKS
jgi:2-polyprenyl-3-methyl-5-hydroxy-6-metoxy-1,4-benzoquinol methylase